MYTTVDRLIRDTCVVNYKSHCHQIKSTQVYMLHAILSNELAGVAGGNPERVIFGGGIPIYFREEIRNPLATSPPKQNHSRAKSRQLRRLTIDSSKLSRGREL